MNYESWIMRKHLVRLVMTLIITVSLSPFANAATKAKPNVVIVITDDQGYGDLASRGNPIIKTPNIDRFAEDSIRFTNFHVSTTCAPTRGAVMTGRHSNRLNVHHTISGRSLVFADEKMLPEVFAENGYTNSSLLAAVR